MNIKILFSLLCTIIISQGFPQNSQSKLDSKFGFRNIKLETNFSELDSKYILKKEPSSSKIQDYTLQGVNMYLDDIPIEHIYLSFVNEKLYTISLHIKSGESTSKLTKLVEDAYGKLQYDKESHDYYIKGKKAELLYQVQGTQLNNGYILASADLTIRSLSLKKILTGSDNVF